MKTIKGGLLVFVSVALLSMVSCKDYHNDFIHWSDNIPEGTNIDSVKKIQPDYIEIAWDKHDTLGNGDISYPITKIRNNWDILNMSYSLAFRNNNYVGRGAHK